MTENSKSDMSRKEVKEILQRARPNISLETMIKKLLKTPMFGERQNAENNCRSKEKRENPYAVNEQHQKCN